MFGHLFSGGKQQDAFHFLGAFLDCLRTEEEKHQLPSIVDKTFKGYLKQTTHCGQCQHQTTKFEKFYYLPLTLSTNKKEKLREVLDYYTSMLSIQDYWCHRCNKHVSAHKQTSLAQLPKTLILCPQACSSDWEKSQQKVQFDRVLSVKSINTQANYKLSAIAVHDGDSKNYGHYTSYCHKPDSWYHFDDTRLQAVSFEKIKTEQSYILHYELKNYENNISDPEIPIKTGSPENILRNILVETPKNGTLCFQINAETTTQDVKKNIFEKTGINVSQQVLLNSLCKFQSTETVADYLYLFSGKNGGMMVETDSDSDDNQETKENDSVHIDLLKQSLDVIGNYFDNQQIAPLLNSLGSYFNTNMATNTQTDTNNGLQIPVIPNHFNTQIHTGNSVHDATEMQPYLNSPPITEINQTSQHSNDVLESSIHLALPTLSTISHTSEKTTTHALHSSTAPFFSTDDISCCVCRQPGGQSCKASEGCNNFIHNGCQETWSATPSQIFCLQHANQKRLDLTTDVVDDSDDDYVDRAHEPGDQLNSNKKGTLHLVQIMNIKIFIVIC